MVACHLADHPRLIDRRVLTSEFRTNTPDDLAHRPIGHLSRCRAQNLSRRVYVLLYLVSDNICVDSSPRLIQRVVVSGVSSEWNKSRSLAWEERRARETIGRLRGRVSSQFCVSTADGNDVRKY